ncbi:hypothetical protein D3C80_505480 [compost metagenome]
MNVAGLVAGIDLTPPVDRAVFSGKSDRANEAFEAHDLCFRNGLVGCVAQDEEPEMLREARRLQAVGHRLQPRQSRQRILVSQKQCQCGSRRKAIGAAALTLRVKRIDTADRIARPMLKHHSDDRIPEAKHGPGHGQQETEQHDGLEQIDPTRRQKAKQAVSQRCNRCEIERQHNHPSRADPEPRISKCDFRRSFAARLMATLETVARDSLGGFRPTGMQIH